MAREFTGRHMAVILVAFFGVIIAVNLTMARYASSTFGGIVVENSYVASQEFNRWLEEAEEQRALGWDAVTTWRPDNRLAIALSGVPEGAEVRALARHPLGGQPDQSLVFVNHAKDRFLSTDALPEGRWILRLEIEADGNVWRCEEELR